MADRQSGDLLTDLVGIDVEEGDRPEILGREPLRAREGVAEVAHADDDDLPLPIEAELTPDLAEEEVDVITGARRAVGTQVGQVLAHFGRVDTRRLGKLRRRDGLDATGRECEQGALVHGQPHDGGLRNPTNEAVGHRG